MSTRDEHFRLLANFANIAAVGAFVASAATAPLNAAISGKLDSWAVTDFMVIFAIGSFVMHGVAHMVLTWIKS